ncbi:TPA: hypothetical protein EYP44_04860, partial [Candidatus Bathyarchaeota archaeon]|nr:hypothetical protein [Candidatus Bathyarchaeota archaeon]
MDAYERVVRVLDFEEPDRVPIFDVIMNTKIYETFGGLGDPLEVAAKTFRRLGIDAVRHYLDPGRHWLVEWYDDFFRYLRVKRDGWVIETTRDDARHQMTWISRRPFGDLEGLEGYMPSFPDKEEIADDYVEAFRKAYKAFWPHTLLIGESTLCFVDAFHFMGLRLFCRALHTAPHVVRRLMDVFTEYNAAYAELFAENDFGPLFFIGDDIAYKHGLIAPLDFLRKEWIPRLKRAMRPLKRRGIKVLFHSDGNIWRILDDLIDAGIDALNPLEPNAGMDVARVKEKYGDRIALFGGVNSAGVLQFGSPE